MSIEKHHIIELSTPATPPSLAPEDSKFSQLFNNLTVDEQSYESFFNFPKEKLCEFITGYYEDFQLSLQRDEQLIIQHVLNFFYNELGQALSIELLFEGTGIGLKEEKFSLTFNKEEFSVPGPDNNTSVIKMVQKNQASSSVVNQNIESDRNQKFAKYIEQTDKVLDCVNMLRKHVVDPEGKVILQMAAQIFILCDILDNSSHKTHTFQFETYKGKLQLNMEQNCVQFDLLNQFVFHPKFKN